MGAVDLKAAVALAEIVAVAVVAAGLVPMPMGHAQRNRPFQLKLHLLPTQFQLQTLPRPLTQLLRKQCLLLRILLPRRKVPRRVGHRCSLNQQFLLRKRSLPLLHLSLYLKNPLLRPRPLKSLLNPNQLPSLRPSPLPYLFPQKRHHSPPFPSRRRRRRLLHLLRPTLHRPRMI